MFARFFNCFYNDVRVSRKARPVSICLHESSYIRLSNLRSSSCKCALAYPFSRKGSLHHGFPPKSSQALSNTSPHCGSPSFCSASNAVIFTNRLPRETTYLILHSVGRTFDRPHTLSNVVSSCNLQVVYDPESSHP